MKNIYVIGPRGIGKSSFIAKFFSPNIAKNIVETCDKIKPKEYLSIFLILPLSYEKTNIDITIEEFYKWVDFYHELEHLPRFRLVEEI